MWKNIYILAFWLVAFSASGGQSQSLGIFEGDYAHSLWRSAESPDAKPMADVEGHGPGLRLMCPLKSTADRCIWDADIRLDLTSITRITFSIKVRDAQAFSRGTIYFRSGEGWYGGWFTLNGEGWQTVSLLRSSFGEEDSPAGWDAISGVRIAIWKGAAINTIVSLAGFCGISDEIIVLRNTSAEVSHPDESRWIKRTTERVSAWLEEASIAAGQFSDDEAAGGFPAACRLVIMPYNPHPPDDTLTALTEFVDRGGKLVTTYVFPPQLAPVLGLTGTTWSATGPDAKFATMRFETPVGEGFPLTMRQDSWNANIPGITNAEVLATWQNGAGEASELPAATINSNGVFLGHLLTHIDRASKQQFLLALVARLVPDKKKELARGALAHADRLLDCKNWKETRELLEQTARQNNRKSGCAVMIESIERYRKGSIDQLATASLGDLLVRADVTRKLIQDAYCSFVSNRGAANEFRGVWCHAADGVPGWSWDEAVKELKDGGCNALFPNMLWSGLAYYPSKVVPMAPEVQSGRDYLRECLDACRRYGVDLHLWKVCWDLSRAEAPYVAELRKQGRLQRNKDGDEVLWLCPSDLRNRDDELKAILEAVRNYPVDGFHFDYIRYPDSYSCYCEGCRQRFVAATGSSIKKWPGDVLKEGRLRSAFLVWRREQISMFVEETSAALRKLRSGIKISAAVYPMWSSSRNSIGQDSLNWVDNGYLDFICPMNYSEKDAEAVGFFDRQFESVNGRVPLYPGIGPSTKGLTPVQVVRRVGLLRDAGAEGFMLFELDHDLLEIHLPSMRKGVTAEIRERER